jgi:hypothetical protein
MSTLKRDNATPSNGVTSETDVLAKRRRTLGASQRDKPRTFEMELEHEASTMDTDAEMGRLESSIAYGLICLLICW